MSIRWFTAGLLALMEYSAMAAAAPNVILLSVDTLRADRLGCYGSPVPTSPNIDQLAQQGLLFEDCVCEVPLTFPSMGSMLTSRVPRSTGTTRNGLRMPFETPTVPEQFQKAGYYTFCVQSNWTLKARLSKLDRGFDRYDDKFHKKRWGLFSAEREAGDVTESALRILAERSEDKPFFAWIHYTDPHAPYEMHEQYDRGAKPRWKMSQAERVRARYDSEIGFVDAKLAEFLAAVPENTVVLFTADHGESLYEHDYLGHGRRVYHDNLHIPLIIRGPGVAPGRSAAPVRGIDIGATLLGLAGLPKASGMEGLDVLRETVPQDRVRQVETYGGAVLKLPFAKSLMAEAKPIYQCLVDEDWKLIWSGRRMQLYHLSEDPKELHECAAENIERAQRMKSMLQQWDRLVAHGKQRAVKLGTEDYAALGSLGYLR